MLVLSRKKNESIIINGNIEITVIELEDGRVRLGIEAPKSIDIHRKEVFEEIARENKASTASKLNMDKLKGKTFNLKENTKKNITLKKKDL
jgi:carbon storage regulator